MRGRARARASGLCRVSLPTLVLGGWLCACGQEAPEKEAAPPPPGRAVVPSGQTPPDEAKAPAGDRDGTGEHQLQDMLAKERAVLEAAAAERAAAQEQRTETPQEADKPMRDYAAELRAAIRSPGSCVEPREAKKAEKTIQIVISAVVMGSGAVSRADVQSGALRDAERKCLQRRAEAARLPSPIEGAPLHVSTRITLEQEGDKQPAEPARKGRPTQ